jgi:galactose mutarotase-like enzyme
MRGRIGYTDLCAPAERRVRNTHETVLRNGHSELRVSAGGATVTTWKFGEMDLITSPYALSTPENSQPGQIRDIYRGGIPILFPVCGWPGEGRLSSRLGLHGFAKDQQWEQIGLVSEEELPASVTFRLSANTETRQVYPYEFDIVTKITLGEKFLRYDFQIANNGKDNQMPYQLGLHAYNAVDPEKENTITADAPGFINDQAILRNSILTAAPAEVNFVIPGKGSFRLNYSQQFGQLITWTDNPESICFEPWTSGPQTIDTDRALKIDPGKRAELYVEMNFEPEYAPATV